MKKDSKEMDKDLTAEIDAGVESAGKVVDDAHKPEAAKPAKPEAAEVETVTAGSDETVVTEVEDVGKPEAKPKKPSAIDDAIIERAVKAGMNMSEVRQYPNAGLLAIACNRLEVSAKKVSDTTGSQDGAGGKKEEKGEADLLAAIPDLDPKEYDENIVSGFKAMKDIIRQQHETIKSMRGDQGKDWMTSQIEGMGITEALKAAPEKREALQAKFDVLTAGYKAAGKDVGRDVILKEAASLTVAGDITAADEAVKKEKLAKRSGQQIARPSGHRQQPKGDAFADVAEELNLKYFSKK